MKKRLIPLMLVLVLLVISVAGCGGQQTANNNQSNTNNQQAIKLKVADLFPTTHPVSAEGITLWMKKVEELTGGKVTFDYYPSEQLGKSKDLLKVVQNKVADIAFVGPSYVTANMPYSGVMELPGAFTTSVEGEQAYWKLTQGILLKDEFQKNKVMPVFVYALPPYEVWTMNKEIHLPQDLKGLKLRSVGGIVDQTINLLGASPVALPITEMYESLQKSVVNGTILSPISIKPYKVQELLKYTTQGASVGTFVGVYVVNQSVWDSLPQDVQKAMLQAGEETSKHLAEVLDKQANDFMKEFEQGGLKVYKLSPKEHQQWVERMAPVEEEWVKKIGSSGGTSEFAKQVLDERKKVLGTK